MKNIIDFPVTDKSAPRRSYSVATIAWTKDKNVSSDVTKLMRAARKLPDKVGCPKIQKTVFGQLRTSVTMGFECP